jgi:hypothetical protein
MIPLLYLYIANLPDVYVNQSVIRLISSDRRHQTSARVSNYQYSNVRYGTTPGERFLRSASQRVIQVDIFARLAELSTLTVAMIRAQSRESAKHVSSKNELCSEYGTPKS